MQNELTSSFVLIKMTALLFCLWRNRVALGGSVEGRAGHGPPFFCLIVILFSYCYNRLMPFDLRQLENKVGREKVLSDVPSITAYSIDASIYKVVPKAVVLIESPADLERTLHYAKTAQVPLTARSGGTNLTGNAVGEGIILEFSRLNRIVELNAE